MLTALKNESLLPAARCHKRPDITCDLLPLSPRSYPGSGATVVLFTPSPGYNPRQVDTRELLSSAACSYQRPAYTRHLLATTVYWHQGPDATIALLLPGTRCYCRPDNIWDQITSSPRHHTGQSNNRELFSLMTCLIGRIVHNRPLSLPATSRPLRPATNRDPVPNMISDPLGPVQLCPMFLSIIYYHRYHQTGVPARPPTRSPVMYS